MSLIVPVIVQQRASSLPSEVNSSKRRGSILVETVQASFSEGSR